MCCSAGAQAPDEAYGDGQRGVCPPHRETDRAPRLRAASLIASGATFVSLAGGA